MSQTIIEDVEQAYLKADLPTLRVGDTVDVHVRIIEGVKERIQIFNGVIISRNGRGMAETITVRRIVANEGVERIFPLHSPRIAEVKVKHRGHVRRARLYYLRDRVGKKRRLHDRRRGLKHVLPATKSKAAKNGPKVAEPQAAQSADKTAQTADAT